MAVEMVMLMEMLMVMMTAKLTGMVLAHSRATLKVRSREKLRVDLWQNETDSRLVIVMVMMLLV